MEKVRPWRDQPSDQGRLKNRTEQMGDEDPAYVHSRRSCIIVLLQASPRSHYVHIKRRSR